MGAASAELDAAGQHALLAELLEDQLDARRPDGNILGDDRAYRRGVLDLDAARVVDLELLGAGEGQLEAISQRLGERTAAEREHARGLDAALADQRNIRGPASDVDEERALLLDTLAAEAAGDRIGLGDDREQLQ